MLVQICIERTGLIRFLTPEVGLFRMLPRKEAGSFLVKIERWFNCTVAASFSFAVGTFSLISLLGKRNLRTSEQGHGPLLQKALSGVLLQCKPRASLFDH